MNFHFHSDFLCQLVIHQNHFRQNHFHFLFHSLFLALQFDLIIFPSLIIHVFCVFSFTLCWLSDDSSSSSPFSRLFLLVVRRDRILFYFDEFYMFFHFNSHSFDNVIHLIFFYSLYYKWSIIFMRNTS